ncbi:MAG: hypothetical protein HUU21_34270, partial [Polyangiaceae bacterium]|nr:hypothetical protein [Polyangiaceae bacterium]
GNTAAKLRAGQAVTVAYFGGGIHDAGGWRAAVGRWLKESYPQAKITLLDGSITDAVRGSGFSVYRFRHDVLEKRPDLVMIDFTSDDHQTPSLDIQRQYEGIFRQARRANPQLDLVLLHAFRAGMESAYRERLTPPAVTAIERVAAAYGVPSINMGLFAADLFAKGGWNGHTPNPALNELYASAVTDGLQTLLAAAPAGEHPLPKPLREDNLEAAGLLPITPAMLSGAWSELPPTHPDRQAQARHFETLWFTNQPGAKLTFTFTGSDASLYWLIGPDTGRIRVTVDGKDQGIKQQVDPWCYYQRLASIGLASGLPPGPHTVVVELLPEPPDRALPIAEAKRSNRYDPRAFEGVALRLGWIRTIGTP